MGLQELAKTSSGSPVKHTLLFVVSVIKLDIYSPISR